MQVLDSSSAARFFFEGESVAGPIPGVTPPTNKPAGIPGQPGGSSIIPPVLQTSGVPIKASPLPLIVCLALLLISGLILLFQFQLGGGFWYFVGYALTPILTSMTLGWDALLQKNGRKDPWFAPSPLFSRVIRIAVALSFVLAFFHILEIAHLCGQSFVQSGALCV
jgi:hypothetical protein